MPRKQVTWIPGQTTLEDLRREIVRQSLEIWATNAQAAKALGVSRRGYGYFLERYKLGRKPKSKAA